MGFPRIRLERRWQVTNPRTELGEDLGTTILYFRMSPAEDVPAPRAHSRSTQHEFWAGSQRTMWVFGALLVDENVLPRTGRITRFLSSTDTPVEQVTLVLEDNIGLGLVDPFTARRFRRLFKRIAARVEDVLERNGENVTEVPVE